MKANPGKKTVVEPRFSRKWAQDTINHELNGLIEFARVESRPREKDKIRAEVHFYNDVLRLLGLARDHEV